MMLKKNTILILTALLIVSLGFNVKHFFTPKPESNNIQGLYATTLITLQAVETELTASLTLENEKERQQALFRAVVRGHELNRQAKEVHEQSIVRYGEGVPQLIQASENLNRSISIAMGDSLSERPVTDLVGKIKSDTTTLLGTLDGTNFDNKSSAEDVIKKLETK